MKGLKTTDFYQKSTPPTSTVFYKPRSYKSRKATHCKVNHVNPQKNPHIILLMRYATHTNYLIANFQRKFSYLNVTGLPKTNLPPLQRLTFWNIMRPIDIDSLHIDVGWGLLSELSIWCDKDLQWSHLKRDIPVIYFIL